MKIDLYRLLPSVYRNRDAYLGEPLRALMGVLGNEIDTLRQDIDRMYDNWFVETCDEWVVPYIGDLLGVEGLHPGRPEVFSLRSFVANTLAYRRRKGTSSVLENIAQDVSGWSVSGVEFFQLLTTTQHQDHVRMTTVWSTEPGEYDRIGAVGTIDVRQIPLLARLGTAFDTASRTIDIRPFTQYDGWHNVDRLGIFLWRLRSYPMREMPLSHLGDVIETVPGDEPGETRERAFQRFSLHPLAVDFPLFASPVRQLGATQRRREWEVPQPIARDAFNADIQRYYGEEKSLLVLIDGEPVSADCVLAADLVWTPETLTSLPEPNISQGDHRVFIDLERGRLAIEPGRYPETGFVDPSRVRVTYHYGFSANIGGGTYGREIAGAAGDQQVIRVSKCAAIDTIAKALALREGPCTVIRIMDSGIYEETTLETFLQDGEEIIIEAADGMRPCIKGYLQFFAEELEGPPPPPNAPGEPAPDEPPTCLEPAPPISRLRLSGLLIKGYMLVEGRVRVDIEHCTFVADPDRPSSPYGTLHVFSLNFFVEIDIRYSLVGSLRINEGIKQLRIRDSIVDATLGIGAGPEGDGDVPTVAICGRLEDLPGPEVIIERSTIIGSVYVRAMPLASESIFTGRVNVIRKQEGCMRYCYVDASIDGVEDLGRLSRTPRRFRCQPDLVLMASGSSLDGEDARDHVRKRLAPVFCSRTYGHPSYARLVSRCPEEIRKGAENGSEIGAFNHLMEPQREANMREAVRRYLPFGLEMNIIYADEETNS
jgi:hypothetical protein